MSLVLNMKNKLLILTAFAFVLALSAGAYAIILTGTDKTLSMDAQDLAKIQEKHFDNTTISETSCSDTACVFTVSAKFNASTIFFKELKFDAYRESSSINATDNSTIITRTALTDAEVKAQRDSTIDAEYSKLASIMRAREGSVTPTARVAQGRLTPIEAVPAEAEL